MPNDLYRITTVFSGKKKGWTESFVIERGGTTPELLAPTFNGLLQLRANLLGAQFQIDGIRISKIRLANGTKVTRNVLLRELPVFPVVQYPNDADAPDSCVIGNARDLTGNNRKQFFLGAPPDDLLVKGGDINPAHPWLGVFASWAAGMFAAGAGWLQSIANLPKQVTNYVINAGGIATFTCEAGTFGAPPYQKQVVRIHGLNSKHSAYNGALLVLPLSDTTCELVNARFAGPFLSRGFITTYAQPLPFIAGQSYQAVKGGNHKRGRPLFSSPGRRAAVVRV